MRPGVITNAGPGCAVRALIGKARSYRMQPRLSRKLYERTEELRKPAQDTALKEQLPVCERHRHLPAIVKS